MFKKLIKLADLLDFNGFYEAANKIDTLIKCAITTNPYGGQFDIIIGQMGCGKSTIAEKLKPYYDLVLCTDLGKHIGGKWVKMPAKEKYKIREERKKIILSTFQAGKKVLLEGAPKDVVELMGPDIAYATNIFYLNVPDEITLDRIKQRSQSKNTDIGESIEKHEEIKNETPAYISQIENNNDTLKITNDPEDVLKHLIPNK